MSESAPADQSPASEGNRPAGLEPDGQRLNAPATVANDLPAEPVTGHSKALGKAATVGALALVALSVAWWRWPLPWRLHGTSRPPDTDGRGAQVADPVPVAAGKNAARQRAVTPRPSVLFPAETIVYLEVSSVPEALAAFRRSKTYAVLAESAVRALASHLLRANAKTWREFGRRWQPVARAAQTADSATGSSTPEFVSLALGVVAREKDGQSYPWALVVACRDRRGARRLTRTIVSALGPRPSRDRAAAWPAHASPGSRVRPSTVARPTAARSAGAFPAGAAPLVRQGRPDLIGDRPASERAGHVRADAERNTPATLPCIQRDRWVILASDEALAAGIARRTGRSEDTSGLPAHKGFARAWRAAGMEKSRVQVAQPAQAGSRPPGSQTYDKPLFFAYLRAEGLEASLSRNPATSARRRTLPALGLENLEALTWTSRWLRDRPAPGDPAEAGRSNGRYVDTVTLLTSGPPRGPLAVVARGGAPRPRVSVAPQSTGQAAKARRPPHRRSPILSSDRLAGALFHATARIDWADLWRSLVRYVPRGGLGFQAGRRGGARPGGGPAPAESFGERIAHWEREMGLRFEQDIFAGFSGQTTLSMEMPRPGALPVLLVEIELADRLKAETILHRAFADLAAGFEYEVDEDRSGAESIYYGRSLQAALPWTPCYVIREDRVIGAASVRALKALLHAPGPALPEGAGPESETPGRRTRNAELVRDERTAAGPEAANSAARAPPVSLAFRGAMQPLSPQPGLLVYGDLPRLLQRDYGGQIARHLVVAAARKIAGLTELAGLDPAHWPSDPASLGSVTFPKHLSPLGLALYAESASVRLELSTPVGGAAAAGLLLDLADRLGAVTPGTDTPSGSEASPATDPGLSGRGARP